MRWVSNVGFMVTIGSLLPVVGCQAPASVQRIAALEVPEADAAHPEFAKQRVLIRRFTDTRPPTVGKRIGGGGFVVPAGYRSEQTTEYWDERDGRQPTVYQGWLPSDLPYLLAKSLPGNNVAVADTLPDAGASASWDYIVEGACCKPATKPRRASCSSGSASWASRLASTNTSSPSSSASTMPAPPTTPS